MEFGDHDPHALADADVVVLALPHGASAELATAIEQINPDITLLDLGADHRLVNRSDWDEFYGGDYAAPWVYGMPELPGQRDKLPGATRIAAPGCNASAITFAVAPLVAAGLSDGRDIVATLAVGYSGAGRKAADHLLASEALGSLAPYSVGGRHRHIPEIAQNLRQVGGSLTSLSMTPILAPVSRGILASCSIPAHAISDDDVRRAYELYAGEPFVRFIDTIPTTGAIIGSNSALVYAERDRDGERITAICALDNLVKGTAGAAIQSLNLALGLPEETGLSATGVAP